METLKSKDYTGSIQPNFTVYRPMTCFTLFFILAMHDFWLFYTVLSY